MNCSTSTITSTTTHQTTREVLQPYNVNKQVEVEHVNIEKDIVNTQVIQKEHLNYVYNINNKNIYQPINNVGTVINTAA